MYKTKLYIPIFVLIGILIGIILSLQIRSDPVRVGSSALSQAEIQKSLLQTFSLEQEDLKKALSDIGDKVTQAEDLIAKRSSKKTADTLYALKKEVGLDTIKGAGIRITLHDNPTVNRVDFSSFDENFVQATDLRDLINLLFLKNAQAISLNGKRVTPLTPVQSLFDTILVGSTKVPPPFVIEAVGDPEALKDVVSHFNARKIKVYLDEVPALTLPPLDTAVAFQFATLIQP